MSAPNAVAFGLVSITMGNVGGTGGMGTTLTQVNDTVVDTASFESAPPSLNDLFVEESDFPFETLISKQGSYTLKWSTYDVDPLIITRMFGGVYTAKAGSVLGTVTAPNLTPVVEQSIIATTSTGHLISIVRARVLASYKWNLAKSKLAQLDVTASVLLPTDGTSAPFTITYPS